MPGTQTDFHALQKVVVTSTIAQRNVPPRRHKTLAPNTRNKKGKKRVRARRGGAVSLQRSRSPRRPLYLLAPCFQAAFVDGEGDAVHAVTSARKLREYVRRDTQRDRSACLVPPEWIPARLVSCSCVGYTVTSATLLFWDAKSAFFCFFDFVFSMYPALACGT